MTYILPDRLSSLVKRYTPLDTEDPVFSSKASTDTEIDELRKTVVAMSTKIQYLESELDKQHDVGLSPPITDIDADSIVAIGEKFKAYLDEGKKDVYGAFGRQSYFQQLSSNAIRYAVAAQLCNYSENNNLKILPLWHDVYINNGQLG